MKLTISPQKPDAVQTDMLVVPVFEDTPDFERAIEWLRDPLKKEARKLAEHIAFKARHKKTLSFFTHHKIPPYLVLFVGIGKKEVEETLFTNRLRELGAITIRASRSYRVERAGLVIADSIFAKLNPDAVGKALVEGIYMGSYAFSKHKKQIKKPELQELIIFTKQPIQKGINIGKRISEGVNLARDLVNEPAQFMKPKDMVAAAQKIAQNSSKLIAITVMDREELKRQNFGGLAAVSQGAREEPYFIHLHYKPKDAAAPSAARKIAIVGKGITFDSGGLSLKPAEFMMDMKIDMAGAASVLGFFSTLPFLKPIWEIHGLIPTCENLPSDTAIKPGDIIKIKNGRTVEVLNTDAEGRLVLADAFSYATELKVDAIIDLATLTGACVAALGKDIAGILGNDRELLEAVIDAAKKAGEKVWQMPLEESYKKYLKSDVADLRNIGKVRQGDTILAALFLKEFVGKTPWLHLDIAGPAWTDKPLYAYNPRGASGFGARTLVEYISS